MFEQRKIKEEHFNAHHFENYLRPKGNHEYPGKKQVAKGMNQTVVPLLVGLSQPNGFFP